MSTSSENMLAIILTSSGDETLLKRSLASLKGGNIYVACAAETASLKKIIKAHGATHIPTGTSRGIAKQQAVEATNAPWLFFLHEGVSLSPDWQRATESWIAEGDERRYAQCRLAIEGDQSAARQMESVVAWGAKKWVGNGEMGLLIHRELLAALGGFKPWPVAEDFELLRELRKRHIPRSMLPVTAESSNIYYERDGYVAHAFKRLMLLYFYMIKVAPDALALLLSPKKKK